MDANMPVKDKPERRFVVTVVILLIGLVSIGLLASFVHLGCEAERCKRDGYVWEDFGCIRPPTLNPSSDLVRRLVRERGGLAASLGREKGGRQTGLDAGLAERAAEQSF